MNTLTNASRSYNRSCGLPAEFQLIKHALQYAEGSMTEEEYAEMYKASTQENRDAADRVMNQLFIAGMSN